MKKNITKIGFLVMCLSLFIGIGKSFAMSLEQAQMAEVNKYATSQFETYLTSTLMKVFYTGSATYSRVAFDGTTFTTTLNTGADLSLAAATYATLGALCDKINTVDYYDCALTGGKRDDATTRILTVSAGAGTNAGVSGGYSLATGGSGSSIYDTRIGITPVKNRAVVLKYCTGGAKTAGTIKIFGKLAKYDGASDMTRNDSTLVFTSIDVGNSTPITVGNIYSGNWMQFAPNEHVVISVGNGTTAQDSATGDILQCFWDEK